METLIPINITMILDITSQTTAVNRFFKRVDQIVEKATEGVCNKS